jgi:hypothetical protein
MPMVEWRLPRGGSDYNGQMFHIEPLHGVYRVAQIINGILQPSIYAKMINFCCSRPVRVKSLRY